MMRCAPSSKGGFTLLELLIVMVMVSLLAMVLVPRMASLGDVDVNQQAEQLRRDLARVQLMAISQSQRLRVSVAAGGYSVSCVAPASCVGVAVQDPQSDSSFAVTLGNGAAFSAAATLDFDSLGRPVNSTGLVATNTVFTLSESTRTVQVQVRPLTGLASLN